MPARAERSRHIEGGVVIKFPKDKKVKPTGPSEVHQPVVGEADFREADPRALVQPFAPMVEQRPTSDLTGQAAVHAETGKTFDELAAAAPRAADIA